MYPVSRFVVLVKLLSCFIVVMRCISNNVHFGTKTDERFEQSAKTTATKVQDQVIDGFCRIKIIQLPFCTFQNHIALYLIINGAYGDLC